jgi:acyl carrier protein
MDREPIPLATMSDEDLHARLAGVIAASLRVDPSRVTPDASLEDLGAASIDLIEITMDLEHAFTVLLPERTVLELASDVGEPGAFEREGRLTALGAALLRDRLPPAVAQAVVDGMPVSQLRTAFLRVDSWHRVIRGLLEATPRTCPACGGRLEQGPPTQVRCRPCSRLFDLPSGDEVGRAWVRRWLDECSA